MLSRINEIIYKNKLKTFTRRQLSSSLVTHIILLVCNIMLWLTAVIVDSFYASSLGVHCIERNAWQLPGHVVSKDHRTKTKIA